MLAYVFWHWPQPNVVVDDYVRALGAFHGSLAEHAPDGFSRSMVFELNKPPWLQTNSIAFEDWYLVKDFGALEKLNLGAVAGRNEIPHNKVAFDAAGGTAGLYALKRGSLESLAGSTVSTWFAKSAEVPYPTLYSHLDAVCSRPDVGLWCRQMTLGPTTEFCLRSSSEISLSREIATAVYSLPVKCVWASHS